MDFGITDNLSSLKTKSKSQFKQLVKIKAREYALDKLTQKQEKHTKMKDLYYSELKTQNYLLNLSAQQGQAVYRYRTSEKYVHNSGYE